MHQTFRSEMTNFKCFSFKVDLQASNDDDDSDETDKVAKKEMLISKRKEKKDKKDKERGYAALEGESSADECSKSRSPSKSKKSKSFKFTTKSKEKREKSRDKDKEPNEKKKERDKKSEKKVEKEKGKKQKQAADDGVHVAEALPIFGVNLETAVERSRCHDGIDLPLPVRECIDYIESAGISFEGVYKISGTKSKVLQIKKMYNQRQSVNLHDYDVPTATSLLKMFLRDLPEPIFTNEMQVRFEEAGAILNLNTREKHLKILVDNLPPLNKLLLSWLVIHLDNIALNEKQNKMSRQNLAAALNHTFHVSSRLLHALIHHSRGLFPNVEIIKYIAPLSSGSQLPDDLNDMEIELSKQESLLNQIHTEMNLGCISKQREELLWEVQRIITQLKRKIKTAYKDKETANVAEGNGSAAASEKTHEEEVQVAEEEVQVHEIQIPPPASPPRKIEALEEEKIDKLRVKQKETEIEAIEKPPEVKGLDVIDKAAPSSSSSKITPADIRFLQLKNAALMHLKQSLQKSIEHEKAEIQHLKSLIKDAPHNAIPANVNNWEGLSQVMKLLQRENQILQIHKINLVRKIIEQQELCIELGAKLELCQL